MLTNRYLVLFDLLLSIFFLALPITDSLLCDHSPCGSSPQVLQSIFYLRECSLDNLSISVLNAYLFPDYLLLAIAENPIFRKIVFLLIKFYCVSFGSHIFCPSDVIHVQHISIIETDSWMGGCMILLRTNWFMSSYGPLLLQRHNFLPGWMVN